MKNIKIRSVRDVELAREVYRYEARLHNKSIAAGMHQFRSHFRAALENSLREAATKAMIFGIKKLTGKYK